MHHRLRGGGLRGARLLGRRRRRIARQRPRCPRKGATCTAANPFNQPFLGAEARDCALSSLLPARIAAFLGRSKTSMTHRFERTQLACSCTHHR